MAAWWSVALVLRLMFVVGKLPLYDSSILFDDKLVMVFLAYWKFKPSAAGAFEQSPEKTFGKKENAITRLRA